MSIYAKTTDNLNAGTYNISASLSCYVNAMGGVEFGESLLKSAQLIVDNAGNKEIKLNLTKSSVTIYSVTCDTFVDASPSGTAQESGSNVTNGTIGYYDKNGKLKTKGVTYTLSNDTALNSQNEAVKYVNSITFPVDSVADTYKLTLFINSNVMGMQFDPATLTVDWSSIKSSEKTNSTSSTTAKVNNDNTTHKKNIADNTNTSKTASSTELQTTNSTDVSNEITTQATNENTDTEVENTQTSDNIVQKDGLDIHYVNDNSNLNLNDKDYSDIPFYVYLNMPVLIGMAIFAGVLIIAGIILILVSKKCKEKKNNEQNS
jgi:hypothetical protein